jgi:signal transduction histidine kinase
MESNGTRVTLETPVDSGAVGLAPDCARHVLLITKEALTNVLRHAAASEI